MQPVEELLLRRPVKKAQVLGGVGFLVPSLFRTRFVPGDLLASEPKQTETEQGWHCRWAFFNGLHGGEEEMSGIIDDLQVLVGQESRLHVCKDDVNQAMIRHWCEAMEDGNPLYTDEAYAKRSKYGGIIAPPQMVQAFSTPPLWPKKEGEPDPFAMAVKRMSDAGYFGVVATTTTQEYFQPMRPGDQLRFKVKLAGVSPQKTTRIGTGHFITAEYTYVNQKDQLVCVQSFTVLTFKP